MQHPPADPVCRVGISGGIGNQLFQYAAGRALTLRTGAKLRLDTSFFDKARHRAFCLDRFPIAAEVDCPHTRPRITRRVRRLLLPGPRGIPLFRERHIHYHAEFESIQPPVALQGYFQSERYFARDADQIRAELTVPPPSDPDSLRLAQALVEQRGTALHIRRGDYVSQAKIRQLYAECSLDYYCRAMESLGGGQTVFVFSDDIGWAKQHLPAVQPLVFVDTDPHRDALRDLWLMTLAHHHIIANSSFSWWGAWLAGTAKGQTIAPAKWFNDPAMDDGDLIPSRWIRM